MILVFALHVMIVIITVLSMSFEGEKDFKLLIS